MVKVLNIIGKRPTGGIGAFTYNYQSHINKNNKIQIDYLLFDDKQDGEFDRKVKAIGSKVYVLPALKNFRLFSIWKKIDLFMKYYGRHYDVLHLHSVNIAFMYFASARKYGVKNLIAHSHATVYSDKKLNALRNKILCLNLKRLANHYLACSKAAGEFLFGKESIENVIVFNNAIECDKFRFFDNIREKIRKELGIEKSYVIGHVGRFCEQKNHAFLIEIFEKCLEYRENAVLLLVGDGPLKENIERIVKKKGIQDRVKFLCIRNDVNYLLQAFDVLVLPSLFEGLPIIGIEAQASGLPLVVSDVITRELKILDVEFISLKNDLSVWANKIINSNSQNREKAYELVRKSGYDINVEANKLADFYMKIANKG